MCSKYRLLRKAAVERRRKKRLLSEGRCVDCTTKITKENFGISRLCKSCYEKDRIRMKKRRDKRRKTGVCAKCGKNPPKVGCTYCHECREDNNKSSANSYRLKTGTYIDLEIKDFLRKNGVL